MKSRFLKTVALFLLLAICGGGLALLKANIKETVSHNEEAVSTTEKIKLKDKLRIMTFNICCDNVGSQGADFRTAGVSDTILRSNADSIGLQEATVYWLKLLYSNEKITETYGIVGVGRDSGLPYEENTNETEEYTPILYKKEKFNLIESGHFWLSETPEKASKGWDAGWNRVCVWAILESKETHCRYVHINTHFDAVGSEARKNSIPLITEKVKEFSDYPVVFSGDLNTLEQKIGYRDLTAEVLRDTKYYAPDTMTFQTFHAGQPEAFKDYILDYIFINSNFNASKYRVMTKNYNGKFISDHYPVYADIYLEYYEQ